MGISDWGDNLKSCLLVVKAGLEETKALFNKGNFTKKAHT